MKRMIKRVDGVQVKYFITYKVEATKTNRAIPYERT
jgi:hypothetical protein